MGKLQKTIVMVGLMGAGKTSVGRKLAEILQVDFFDSDSEIVDAAGMPIAEIFAKYGEEEFRRGEAAVISRLVGAGASVLSTGGGAFMSDENRQMIAANGVSVWLNVDVETLWSRVADKPGRPLLDTDNPKKTLTDLAIQRTPTYQLADVSVVSTKTSTHEEVALAIIEELRRFDRANSGKDIFEQEENNG